MGPSDPSIWNNSFRLPKGSEHVNMSTANFWAWQRNKGSKDFMQIYMFTVFYRGDSMENTLGGSVVLKMFYK